MERRTGGTTIAFLGALAVGSVAIACGGGPAGSGRTTILNGSGATFPRGFYEVVIQEYRAVQPDVTVNYAGGGSGTGRQNLRDGVVDFAGSDAPVKPEDVPKYKGPFLYFPTVAAPITLSYNLPDVETLRLDADTVARIFQRQIKRWNDPAIAALNQGVDLPSDAITVAHRSDGSGTTENFTKYLVKAAPNTWTRKAGATVEWPSDTQAGNGNQGVAQIVKGTEGAIGYIDLSDAKASGLQVAEVKNRSGGFVAPTVDAATAAVAGAQINPDLTYDPLDAGGADAYPITAPTWILAYENQPDKAKGQALQSFLGYLLSDAGQEIAPAVDYARLPPALQQQAQAQVTKLVVPA